ncbi:MAG: aldehyde dehydrogenase family protein [Gammaproteobacteria bacterium]
MSTALLLVDIQRDFLDRSGLTPGAEELIARTTDLLHRWRRAALPVCHVQTRIQRDGSNRMAHWVKNEIWSCVEGTAGIEPPASLLPLATERVFVKNRFSGFGNPHLDNFLKSQNIKRVVIAGLYLHGCVRSTALDAFERDYEVWIVSDAVASPDPIHAESTRLWLNGRVAKFVTSAELAAYFVLNSFKNPAKNSVSSLRDYDAPTGEWLPAFFAGGSWHRMDRNQRYVIHRDPSNISSSLYLLHCCGPKEIARAAAATRSVHTTDWPPNKRLECLSRWQDILIKNRSKLLDLLTTEIAKPIQDAAEEHSRSLLHIETTLRHFSDEKMLHSGISVQFRPLGCIGLITPWNNPLAIPVGKLAPAIAYGNTVVWKPAPQTARLAGLLIETLNEAGLPRGLVNLVHGDGETARCLIKDPHVSAISLTGSNRTGQIASALCALANKPLQAELGGNNAAIILGDADLDACINDLALAAFSFSGQRCTAIRRFIVARDRIKEFERRLAAAVESLPIGQASNDVTRIGPLISSEHLVYVEKTVEHAFESGARRVAGAYRPAGFKGGNWYAPTLLADLATDTSVIQEETFGPVAVILPVDNIDEAISLANSVHQGLLATLVTNNPKYQSEFIKHVEAGVVKLSPGPLNLHPDAPFGGWKSSGIGPPEHGIWDREFFTRPRAIYN